MFKKGISAIKKRIPQGVKDTVKGGISVAKSAIKKAAPVIKAGAKGAIKAIPKIGLAAAGLGGAAVLGSKVVGALRNRGKREREALANKNKDAEGKTIPSTAEIRAKSDRVGGGNAGASTDSGGTAGPIKTETKPETKPETKTETKPKKMHPIEKKNRARLGDAKVDALKAKNADFKLMRKGTMSKDDFIKKYPKSITAQKSKGLRDHTEWDAYDMVLEYLFSTEQVTSLEEANYVMMEMEQQTIGEIVKEVTSALNEDL